MKEIKFEDIDRLLEQGEDMQAIANEAVRYRVAMLDGKFAKGAEHYSSMLMLVDGYREKWGVTGE